MRISTGIVMALTAACALGMQGQSGAATDRGAVGAATGSVSEDLARRAAMPEAAHGMFVPVTTKTFSYERAYAGKDTTDLVGYTFRAVGRGYSGNIETVVGVDLAGRITGTEVVAHKETPGTGGKIVEVKPAKSVLDVLRPNGTAFAARKVAIDLGGPWKGVVEITDADAAGRLEQALAAGDTSLVIREAGAALRLVGAQCLPENRGLAYAIAGAAVRELRREPVPWWQAQFIGKRQADLVLTKQKGSPGIQAITGATVSTRAVTESIKNGMIQLEQAVGGFRAPKEAKP